MHSEKFRASWRIDAVITWVDGADYAPIYPDLTLASSGASTDAIPDMRDWIERAIAPARSAITARRRAA